MARTHLAALDALLRVQDLLARDLARFEAGSGLTGARTHLLWVLGTSPRTQRSLAAELGVTPRNVTGLVDGLVASGHVTREPHPTDRRATLVTPTPRGRRCVEDLRQGRAELARTLFADVPADRLAATTTTLREVGADLERLLARPAGP